jgi:hypothetical protein
LLFTAFAATVFVSTVLFFMVKGKTTNKRSGIKTGNRIKWKLRRMDWSFGL